MDPVAQLLSMLAVGMLYLLVSVGCYHWQYNVPRWWYGVGVGVFVVVLWSNIRMIGYG